MHPIYLYILCLGQTNSVHHPPLLLDNESPSISFQVYCLLKNRVFVSQLRGLLVVLRVPFFAFHIQHQSSGATQLITLLKIVSKLNALSLLTSCLLNCAAVNPVCCMIYHSNGSTCVVIEGLHLSIHVKPIIKGKVIGQTSQYKYCC